MLPIEFINIMQRHFGQEFDSFAQSLESEPATSVRINDKLVLQKTLERVPWCSSGYYLPERPQFTLDPLLHAGCYYVQEASSMFVEQVLRQYVRHDAVILDLCAAPGGKSTLLSQWLGDEGLLVSNEVVRQRVFILSENMQKWGNGNTVVTHNQASDFGERCENLFDCALVDAPCSGEGMFRKDKQAIDEWSEENVKMCAKRQREILTNMWASLKPGGILIYSTCTFNTDEDDNNARWIRDELGADILPVKIEKEWGITETIGYHFYPHKVRGEGFYLCAFRKHGNNGNGIFRCKKTTMLPSKPIAVDGTDLRQWLRHPEHWHIRQSERFADAYPAKWQEVIETLNSQLTCILTGFGIGELRGKNIAPQHSLAMLKDFKKEVFPNIEVNHETSLQYLRTEALTIPNVPLGTLVITYKHIPLGFVKNVGNRCNNLYPNEWRIRKL